MATPKCPRPYIMCPLIRRLANMTNYTPSPPSLPQAEIINLYFRGNCAYDG